MEDRIEKIIKTLESLTVELKETLISMRNENISTNQENKSDQIKNDLHEEILDLCKNIIRKDTGNKLIIKSIVSRYSDGKLKDVPVEKLSELRSEIIAECNYAE